MEELITSTNETSMDMDFTVGQIFSDMYPPEAAIWCNENNAFIVELEPEEGTRRFEIQAIPEPTLEEVRERKLTELNTRFEAIRNTAWIMSSLGFEADANEVANTNIEGLIKTTKATGQEPVYFCDKNNQYHALGLTELETLQLEVIQNGQQLYAQKWTYRDSINAATTVEEIENITIQFTMMDFTA